MGIEVQEDRMMPNPFGVYPSRLNLAFASGLTKNVDRIELFVTQRAFEQPSSEVFVMSEALRQLTFSPNKGSAARQMSGEYCHFFTYQRLSDNEVAANILTAVYADALQLERFFVKVGSNRPIIVFSHSLRLTRDRLK